MSRCDYIHRVRGDVLPEWGQGTPFRAVVIVEQAVTTSWQEEVSDWLVRAGCLYMMAWGHGCSTWDDAVDDACLRAFDYGDIPDDRFVLTTWHDDESLEEVLTFARHHAHHPDVPLERTLLVHIAPTPWPDALLQAFADA